MTTGSGGHFGETPESNSHALDEITDALGDQTETLETVLNTLSDLVLFISGRNIRAANGTVATVLGYDPEELVGDSVDSILAEGEQWDDQNFATATDEFEQALSDQAHLSPRVLPFETADDTVRVLSASLTPAAGGLVCLASETDSTTLTEIQRERDALSREKAAIEQERNQYAELVETVGDPMYVLDASGTIEQVNEAMVEYTGYDREELEGREMAEIVPASEYEEATTELATLAESPRREAATFETRLVTKSGRLIITEANVRVLTDESGAYSGSIGSLRDIHDRKQRERDLELLKQLLTRVFRHNVRNRLLVVQGHAEMIRRQSEDDISACADKIIQSAEQLLTHAEKARDIEQVVELDERTDIDLAAMVSSLLADVQADNPNADITEALPEAVTVEAHPMLKTAVEELLDNAIRHAPSDVTANVQVWIEETDDSVTLFVEDESGGLTDHEIEVLRSGGEGPLEHSSGVGLWLVYWIVESSGADMIAHRTDDGSLMGIKFTQERGDISQNSFAHAPDHLREEPLYAGYDDAVVGRTDELRKLEDTYDALSQRGGHALLLTGETGIGKTMLVDEFVRELDQRDEAPLTARGGCEPGMTPPYHVFRQILADLPESTGRQEWFEQRWRTTANDPETRQRRREALFEDMADELRTLSVDRPVIVILEDLQWADTATIELLEYLVDDVGQWALPILFIGTYRTDTVQSDDPVTRLTTATEDTERREVFELEALSSADISTLLCELLDVETVPEKFVADVRTHTGGNPQFVTAIGKHLADTVGPNPTPADLPESIDGTTLPKSLESAATDRLEPLLTPVKQVLGLGAVIGKTVSLDVLREASDLPESELLGYVDRLVDQRIWRDTDNGFEFVHGVLRERTLETLAEADKRERHRNVASAIEAVYPGTSARQYVRLATHYQNAGDTEQARTYHEQAGRHALESHAYDRALEHYQQVLELAAGDARERAIAAAHQLAEIYLIRSEYDRAEEYVEFARNRASSEEIDQRQRTARLTAWIAVQRGEFHAAVKTATTGLSLGTGKTVEHCRLLCVKAEAEWRKSDYQAAEETCKDCRELAASLDNRSLQAEASELTAKTVQERAEYDRAREYYHEALELAQEAGDRHHEADIRTGLGVVAKRQGRTEQAREYYEQALEAYNGLGDSHQAARIYNNLAILAKRRGDYETTKEYYRNTIETATAVGDDNLAAIAHFNLGSFLRLRSEFEQAREYVMVSLQTWEEMGDDHSAAIAKSDLGYHLTLTGEYDEAETYLDAARVTTDEIGDMFRYANVLRYLGMRARRLGKYDQASEYYEEALETARQIDNDEIRAEVRLGMADLAYRQGADETARRRCLEALDYLRDQDAQNEIATALRILALVCSRMDSQESDTTAEIEAPGPEDCLREAREIYRAVESDHGEARIGCAAGVVARRNREYERAKELFEEALQTLERLGMTHDAGRVRHELGLVSLAVDNRQSASTYLETALDDFLAVGAPVDAVATLGQLLDIEDTNRVRELCDTTADCASDRGLPEIEAEVATLRSRLDGE